MAYPTELIQFWSDHNITPPVEKVVCAANRLACGTIICGARHWDKIMCAVANKLKDEQTNTTLAEEGFINQFGVFLDRREALQVVLASGQPFDPDRNKSDTELFSEGLY